MNNASSSRSSSNVYSVPPPDSLREKAAEEETTSTPRTGGFRSLPKIGDSSFEGSQIEVLKSLSDHPERIEILVPSPGMRPWSAPKGFFCLPSAFFLEAKMRWPVPHLLVEFCSRRRIMFAQLSPGSVANMVALLVLGHQCGVRIPCWKFEAICNYTEIKAKGTNALTSTFYSALNPKKIRSIKKDFTTNARGWIQNYFFVRKNRFSIYDPNAEVVQAWGLKCLKPGRTQSAEFEVEVDKIQASGTLAWGSLTPDMVRDAWNWHGTENWDRTSPAPVSDEFGMGVAGGRAIGTAPGSVAARVRQRQIRVAMSSRELSRN